MCRSRTAAGKKCRAVAAIGRYIQVEPQIHSAKAIPNIPSRASGLPLTIGSPSADKIALFRNLFRGRGDVYPVYWISERTGKKGYSPAVEDPWSSGKGTPKQYLPLTDEVIHLHLVGERVIGCYPLLKDNTCWFLACDFDKDGWVLDSLAYLESCRRFQVPAYLERSRSGKAVTSGSFSDAVSAILARQLGMRLLRETMNAEPISISPATIGFSRTRITFRQGGSGISLRCRCRKKAGLRVILSLSTRMIPNCELTTINGLT